MNLPDYIIITWYYPRHVPASPASAVGPGPDGAVPARTGKCGGANIRCIPRSPAWSPVPDGPFLPVRTNANAGRRRGSGPFIFLVGPLMFIFILKEGMCDDEQIDLREDIGDDTRGEGVRHRFAETICLLPIAGRTWGSVPNVDTAEGADDVELSGRSVPETETRSSQTVLDGSNWDKGRKYRVIVKKIELAAKCWMLRAISDLGASSVMVYILLFILVCLMAASTN